MNIYIPSLEEARQYHFVPESYEWPEDAKLKGWGGNHGHYTSGTEHHCYGKPLSEEHKEKIRKAKSGKPQPNCSRKGNPNWDGVQEMAAAAKRKKVRVNGVIYNSCTEAAKAVDVTLGTFSYWLKKGKAEYDG